MSPEVQRGPLSPAEAGELQTQQIPEEVFGAFNTLIAKNLSQGQAKVLQKDVISLLVGQGVNREAIFDNKWLDVEGQLPDRWLAGQIRQAGFIMAARPLMPILNSKRARSQQH